MDVAGNFHGVHGSRIFTQATPCVRRGIGALAVSLLMVASLGFLASPSGAAGWVSVWYHPNDKNYTTETPECATAFVTIPHSPDRVRHCLKDVAVFGGGTRQVAGHCPTSHPMLKWWGFYPEAWYYHGAIVVDQLKEEHSEISIQVKNIDFTWLNVGFDFWFDCGN